MEKNQNGVVGEHDMSKPPEVNTFDPSWSDEGILELEVVSLSKRYPKLLEPYLLQSFPKTQQVFSIIRFTYMVDPYNSCITLSTTRKEPAVIRRAKEFLQLVVHHMPTQLAFKLFTGWLSSDIIKIWRQDGGLCKDIGVSGEQFHERKNLFRDSRDALERLTSCKIIIQSLTIVVIGKSEGIKIVRDMVKDCFVSNESPAPKIRRAERELARKDIEAVRRRLHEKQH
ncbi:hypothetical protein RchiOBHm_Chr1g0368141 [Rosa chinensis]|uniref:KRR-R motif-containing protein 1 n=1 Tax=Rosa chinensis TaxID=74649 RepID=A0A2P6SKQ3_ROSCH|nr:hypothetical protein RchiOBHm_Chr1g0368141 [Rosa chinensis]